MYLRIDHANGYIERSSTGEKKGNKYLIFDSVDENKELLKKIQWCLEGSQRYDQRIKQWWMWL